MQLDPGRVPASNVIFLRPEREKNIDGQFDQLAAQCWPLHQAVIEGLEIKVILCFGKRAGGWVRKRLNANDQVDEFIERNERRWTSTAYMNPDGVAVIVATHPSIVDWTTPEADPTPLVERMLTGKVDVQFT
ncbi:MAG TPA: hypothetical protein VIY90_09365 [Steroidobacteraceae bacterium]